MIKKLKSFFCKKPKAVEPETFVVGDLEMSVCIYFIGQAITPFTSIKTGYTHQAEDFICGHNVIKFRSTNDVLPGTDIPYKEPWRYAIIPDDIEIAVIGDKKHNIPIQAFEVRQILLMPALCTPNMYPDKSFIPANQKCINE